uniref:SFRICE_025020 n=1 Tax=Spodoptera frugiperda TaxID=7108 RepID=A0A2H1WTY6_SPOFR
MTSQLSCIAHTKFTCELTRIENPNEQQLGRKPARHDHLAWSKDPPLLRELYSLFPKISNTSRWCTFVLTDTNIYVLILRELATAGRDGAPRQNGVVN